MFPDHLPLYQWFADHAYGFFRAQGDAMQRPGRGTAMAQPHLSQNTGQYNNGLLQGKDLADTYARTAAKGQISQPVNRLALPGHEAFRDESIRLRPKLAMPVQHPWGYDDIGASLYRNTRDCIV